MSGAPTFEPAAPEPYAWFWHECSCTGVLTLRQDYEGHRARYPGMKFTPVYLHPAPQAQAEQAPVDFDAWYDGEVRHTSQAFSSMLEFGRVVWAAAVGSQPCAPTWRCFHCDETFTDREQARLHFGDSEHQQALCTIDAAHFRWMEAQHRRNVDDDSEALRTIARLAGEHETLRLRAEELGYERGLRDAKKHPAALGLQLISGDASAT
jgi:hypothetical protein